MFISEIFHSIQGEGELTGIPSVFIRTSGCNLRCNWCDTMYASWEPEGEELPVEKILDQIDSFGCDHVVLTGGEPMVAKGINDLARHLHESGKHITIETAGTVLPSGVACDLASLSPKLSNSAPDERLSEGWREKHEKIRWQLSVLREWIQSYPFQLKFVVQAEADLPEIHQLLDDLDMEIPPGKVLLMPEGQDSESLNRRSQSLVEVCKANGYRLCQRLHVDLFGNKRGT